MRLLLVLSVGVLFLGSCKKDETQKCIARSADGTPMYEVEGQATCEDQIDRVNGEYCDCSQE